MKVEYVDHMGNDLSVINAARVSFDKQSEYELDETLEFYKVKNEDQKLIKYLASHNHWTPFAHTSISLRVGAPVPIRTQCFKHKQGFVENEESRRYISSVPELFVPKFFRNKPEGSVKQGSSGIHPRDEYWTDEYLYQCNCAINTYMEMVEDGVCPEQARFILPQGVMVNWIWTGNLYSFANFYKKRTDPHAQVEVQEVAKLVGEVVESLFPLSWKALVS